MKKKPPRATRASRTARTDSARAMTRKMPKADRSGAAGDLPPFLKSGDIGEIGESAVLTLTGDLRVTEGQFGSQLVIGVRLNNAEYAWGVRLNSPNHRILEDRVGQDTRAWRNKKIPVTVRENLGKLYVAADRPS